MTAPKVAIVYLSYNARPYLDEVADSIARLDYPKDKLEWIIVDNASPDGSADAIRERVLPRSGTDLPKVTFFPSETNEGFAAGNNLGIGHALLEGADFVYLLNNDAKLHPDAIMEAVRMAESDEAIGSVQSLMRLWQDEERVNSTGGMVHFLGFGFVRDNGKIAADISAADGEEIFYGSGAATLYRASALRLVGLLDPFLFLYHEDLELGWRLRLAGYRNVLAKHSVAYHQYEFKRSVKKFFWMERNRVLVHLTHLTLPTLLLLAPFLFGIELALVVFGIHGGWIREKLLVYRAFLEPRTWKYVIETRRTVRELRKVSDREIAKLFTARIDHQETMNPIVKWIGNPLLSGVWWGLRKLMV